LVSATRTHCHQVRRVEGGIYLKVSTAVPLSARLTNAVPVILIWLKTLSAKIEYKKMWLSGKADYQKE